MTTFKLEVDWDGDGYASAGGDFADTLINTYNADALWKFTDVFADNAVICHNETDYNGTATGVTWQDTASPIVSDENSAPKFDGTNDYFNLFTTAFRDIFDGDTCSVMIWVKPDTNAFSAVRHIWRMQGSIDFRTQTHSSGDRIRALRGSAFVSTFVGDTDTFTGWHMLTVTTDDATNAFKIYFDNALLDSCTQSSAFGTLTSFLIGASADTPSNVFEGWLAWLTVWSGTELSLNDIQAIYAASQLPGSSEDDLTLYTERAYWSVGAFDLERRVASTGQMTAILDNGTKNFSPAFTGGDYYGRLVPGLNMRLTATVGVTTHTLFTGYTRSFEPDAGAGGRKMCTMVCEDRLGLVQRAQISLPLQENYRFDHLLALIASDVFEGGRASSKIGFLYNPDDGDTFTMTYAHPETGTETTVYTFKNALVSAYDVLIAATRDETAENFSAAVNNADGEEETYGANTYRNGYLVADDPVDGTEFGGGDITPYAGSAGNWPLGATADPGSNTYWMRQTIVVATGGNLTSMTTDFGATTGAPSGTVTWEFTDDSETVIQTGTFTPSASATNTITPTDLFIEAGTYRLVFRPTAAQSPGNYWTIIYSIGTDPYAAADAEYNTDGGGWGAWGNGEDLACSFTIASITRRDVILRATARGIWWSDYGSYSSTGDWRHTDAGDDTAGTDAPAGATDFETGTQAFGYAAENWDLNDTNAITAFEQSTNSEWGFFWIARDGTLVGKNRNWYFTRATSATDITIAAQGITLRGRLTGDTVYNRMIVNYTPKTTKAVGVIAQANRVLRIPGKGINPITLGQGGARPLGQRYSRLNGYAGGSASTAPAAGETLTRLSFTDPDTGQVMGAKNVINPVPGTDYTVYDDDAGEGFNYTNTSPRRHFPSAAVVGSGVEIAWKNTATGELYIRGLQVRGTAIIGYDPQQAIRQDDDSTSDYGLREKVIDIPFHSTENFAGAIANYMLARYKIPRYIIESVELDGLSLFSAVSPLATELGHVAALTDDQLGISERYVVMGIDGQLDSGSEQCKLTFRFLPLDDSTYWLLEDATYGVLGETTRLAI